MEAFAETQRIHDGLKVYLNLSDTAAALLPQMVLMAETDSNKANAEDPMASAPRPLSSRQQETF